MSEDDALHLRTRMVSLVCPFGKGPNRSIAMDQPNDQEVEY